MNGHMFDVILLDGGLAASIMGSILARHGHRVLLLESKGHPRFTIGESTVPQTSWMLRVMAARYDVPELDHLSSFRRVQQHISAAGGVKRNFGFVYHREGQPQRLEEANQVGATQGNDSENHLLRQDVDAYYFRLAIRYGAEMRYGVSAKEIDVDESGARVLTSAGETLRARFIIDSTGPRSILANRLQLRDNPTRCKAHSRSLFTHMVGVRPYEDCVTPLGGHGMPSKWSQGTLHHMFDGGWMWVIPFDNHEASVNSACSVGLCVDPRRFPRPEGDPQAEFQRFLDRYPSIAVQFKDARAVRDWVSTDRIQYSSKRTCGSRFALLSHTAGFIDALFSRGLANTMESVNILAAELMSALRDDDFNADRFARYERSTQGFIDFNDNIVNCSFISFRDFGLWNAWYRVWVLGAILGVLRAQRAKMRFDETGDRAFLEALDTAAFPGSFSQDHAGFNELCARAIATVEAVEAGAKSPAAAADDIFGLLERATFAPPVYPFTSRTERFSIADKAAVDRVMNWVDTQAPEEMRRLYFDVRKPEWLDGVRSAPASME